MASGRLGAHISSGAGTYTVYTVPVGKTAELNINVFNNSGAVNKVTLFRSPTGTPSATHTIQLDSIDLDSGYERTAIVLSAGEYICYTTDRAGTNVLVSGVEYDSLSNEIIQQELITTNTETVIYSNSGADAGTVNITVSLADGSAISDTVTCTLYVSATNAASGYRLNKEMLTVSGVSGFEKTGFTIASTDKIILVTTGIVGEVATTVSGYSK